MNKKVITLRFVGEDSWGRNVYKNIENGRLYKDTDCINHTMQLCTTSCFDGEPDCPISADIEVQVLAKENVIPLDLGVDSSPNSEIE